MIATPTTRIALGTPVMTRTDCKRNVNGRDPLDVRFWGNVNTSSDEGACWLWEGTQWGNGYGKILLNHKKYLVHRMSWMLHFGEIPDGLFVCHKCDNPPCVNPAHLFLGTNADNMRDMWQKGRGTGTPPHPLGEDNGLAKLTAETVREIRRLHAEERLSEVKLALQFHIAPTTAGDVIRRRTWKHIP